MKSFDIYVKLNKYSEDLVYYATVQANSLEEAEKIVESMDLPEYYDDIFVE